MASCAANQVLAERRLHGRGRLAARTGRTAYALMPARRDHRLSGLVDVPGRGSRTASYLSAPKAFITCVSVVASARRHHVACALTAVRAAFPGEPSHGL
jgi:hypothetical protein